MLMIEDSVCILMVSNNGWRIKFLKQVVFWSSRSFFIIASGNYYQVCDNSKKLCNEVLVCLGVKRYQLITTFG